MFYIQALVECDGDSIDLSGDVGAVGRIVISNGPAENHGMLLDLKGSICKHHGFFPLSVSFYINDMIRKAYLHEFIMFHSCLLIF